MEYVFGQFTPEHLEKMKEGVELFNQQKYWECHEALEDVWMEDRNDPARNIYWAVIQVAASCIHFRDKNIIGAQGMLNKAKEKFRRCREQNILTPLAFQFLDWEELEKIVFDINDKEASLQAFEPLFNFRFKHYQ
jgi:uncharacterized protein